MVICHSNVLVLAICRYPEQLCMQYYFFCGFRKAYIKGWRDLPRFFFVSLFLLFLKAPRISSEASLAAMAASLYSSPNAPTSTARALSLVAKSLTSSYDTTVGLVVSGESLSPSSSSSSSSVQCLSASDTSYCSDRASERISGDVGFRWTCSMYIVTCRLDGCSRQICTFPPRIELDPKEGNHSGKGTTLDGNHSGK